MEKLLQFDGKNLYCGGISADISDTAISQYCQTHIQGKPVILYGTGSMGVWLLQEFEYAGIPVAAVCDTYKKEIRFGERVRPVDPLPEALSKYSDAYVLVSSISFYDEIFKMVQAYIPKERILNIQDLAAEIPVAAGYTYRNYVIEHLDTLNWLAEILEDEQSREVLREVVLGRISRDSSRFSRIASPCPYFTSDIVQLREDETFIDGGAYIGDTIADFMRETKGAFRKIFSFEPDKKHCEQICRTYADLLAQDRLAVFQKGLWSCRETLRFIENDFGSFLTTDPHKNDFIVETVSLDDCCIAEPVSFIKLDIEGSELQALQGARQLICKNRPVLAICVYHKIEDLVEIPRYIHSLQPGYRYYLRHHGSLIYDTVFYAIPEERVKQ